MTALLAWCLHIALYTGFLLPMLGVFAVAAVAEGACELLDRSREPYLGDWHPVTGGGSELLCYSVNPADN